MKNSFLEKIMMGISIEDAQSLCHYLLETASEIEIASLLTALKLQGHTYEVILGFTIAMKEMALSLSIPQDDYMDVCGTGGDGINTFNISSTVSLVISDRLKVTKHGNRSVTSQSGSADLYEALGYKISDQKALLEHSIKHNNFTFLYAPYVHPKMKNIMPVRKALGFPTIFNIIGPLCNPVPLTYQIIGVYDEALMLPIAKSLLALGVKSAAVIFGHHGMDELSTTGPNKVILIEDKQLKPLIIDPLDYGMSYQSLEIIKGGSPKYNASITLSILSNQAKEQSHIVALNAGFAFYIGKITNSIHEGINLAYEILKTKSLKETS